ncbi:ROK family protein [Devosia sp.]|uniref:ROK family protein n=1 Tax=Devosia sp. TaxID=1871048 RepID=UPI0032669AE8
MTLCFDIGGSAIKSATISDGGEIGALSRVPTPLQDFAAFTAALAEAIDKAEIGVGEGVAISITGVIDPDSHIIKCANIACIDGRALAPELTALLGRPVLVANDADCFALAEAGAGAGRGHRIVFGAILGTGVGGALVIEGKVLQGAGGIAGEWGHGPAAANFAGPNRDPIPSYPCGCGQVGCVDTIGAARGLERLHRHLHGVDLPSTQIVALWEGGDAVAAHTVDCYVDLVASPLALVVNVVGASIVPVGGGMSNSTALIAGIDAAVRKRILRTTSAPLVVPGQCRVEPGLIGASLLAQGAH